LQHTILGILALACGVGLFSTVEVTSKLIELQVDPIVLTFIRFFITGVTLLIISSRTIYLEKIRYSFDDFKIFIINGVIGVALAISIFHVAITILEKASSSAVIFCVNPVFVIIFARYLNNESLSARKWISAILGVLGVLFFAYESGTVALRSVLGLSVMLVSAVLFAFSLCFAKKYISRYGAMVLMGFSSFIGSIVILPYVLLKVTHESIAAIQSMWFPVFYLSFIATALAYAFYYWGLKNTSAHMAGMSFFLKPIMATICAILLLGETINIYMIIGTALIISGLGLTLAAPSSSGNLSNN